MGKKEEYTLIKLISLIIFILIVNLVNPLSFKILALNENHQSTPSFDNEMINKNNSILLPGGNMTFGTSLDNAKMHLMEAIMDIEDNNIEGGLMQLNLTSDYIKMHEQEMADMMFMINKMR